MPDSRPRSLRGTKAIVILMAACAFALALVAYLMIYTTEGYQPTYVTLCLVAFVVAIVFGFALDKQSPMLTAVPFAVFGAAWSLQLTPFYLVNSIAYATSQSYLVDVSLAWEDPLFWAALSPLVVLWCLAFSRLRDARVLARAIVAVFLGIALMSIIVGLYLEAMWVIDAGAYNEDMVNAFTGTIVANIAAALGCILFLVLLIGAFWRVATSAYGEGSAAPAFGADGSAAGPYVASRYGAADGVAGAGVSGAGDAARICPRCGARCLDDEAFCNQCGSPLEPLG